jgi:transcriptional regulator with XRE-family HTH domain
MFDILNRIKELQELRGWSNYRLAKEAGVSEGSINNMFRLKNLPTMPTIEALCGAFDITLPQFFANNTRESVELTAEQSEMIDLWNTLTKDQKQALGALLRTFL